LDGAIINRLAVARPLKGKYTYCCFAAANPGLAAGALVTKDIAAAIRSSMPEII